MLTTARGATRRWFHAVVTCTVLWIVPICDAAEGQIDPETADEMTTAFNQGAAAFEKREWANAIAGMEKVISICENYPDKSAIAAAKDRLAPVYYTVGAAAFNVPDYAKAIAAFERFVSRFPYHEKVPFARLSIARATFLNKDFNKAAELFAAMEQYPSLREQSLVIQAQCFKESGKTAEMVAVVERLIADGITTPARAGAALMLAQARSQAAELDKLAPLLEQLVARRQMVENVVELNALIVGLGDSQAEKEQFEKASRTYLTVMPPAQVIAFQKQRIESQERRIAANKALAARNPQGEITLASQNADLQSALDQSKGLLAEFEKLPDYMPALMLRNSRCWYGREMKWESILVNDRLIKLYPNAAKEREAALFGNVICYADLMRITACQEVCAQYLKEFPKGENAGTVAYVQGAVAMQGGDVKGAASMFGTLVESHPDSRFIDQMYLMLASAHFSMGEMDEALRAYKTYIGKFPTGPAIEEAKYRSAIIPVFQGKYEDGWKLLEAFLKEYPVGPFAEDAEYRLMICKYAANLYDEVLTAVAAWQNDHPGGIMEPEVLSLKGDCLAAQMKNKEAADAYMAAAKNAATDEVLNYALNEASRLLQKLGDMATLSQMWEDFIEQRPDHPSVVAGIYWIGKAKTREGKVDEAKEITVTQLKRSLNNLKNESVEMLLQQLAQLCWKRPRAISPPPAPEPAPVLDKDGKPVPEPPAPPPLPPWDAMAELEKQIEPLAAIADASGRLRLDFLRIELLKLLKNPGEVEKLMFGIATSRPDVLSPQLLALAGEFLQANKRDAEAADRYNYLKDNFLKSAWLDYAYSGLGAMELAKGNAAKALELYTLAADDYAGAKIKESTLGLAIAMMENGRYPEARKLFEQVAGTREWRGESTAQAVFYLGMVEERQSHLPEAVAHYQRVFVAYQKYTVWVEKAYIKAAQCFDKLGKRKEAIDHLNEVLRNDKLGYAVKSEARELLKQWGVNS
ncbi:MAG: outer membrane protein assembly factor BamD [Verrucomicrobiota bacterium]